LLTAARKLPTTMAYEAIARSKDAANCSMTPADQATLGNTCQMTLRKWQTPPARTKTCHTA
jgi:hypothetical protein